MFRALIILTAVVIIAITVSSNGIVDVAIVNEHCDHE